jgi:hypothetical protein
MCVCVCERENESESESEREREWEIHVYNERDDELKREKLYKQQKFVLKVLYHFPTNQKEWTFVRILFEFEMSCSLFEKTKSNSKIYQYSKSIIRSPYHYYWKVDPIRFADQGK